MIGGRVQLASETLLQRLPTSIVQELEPLWIDGTVRWLRAPIKQLLASAEQALGAGTLRLGGKPIRLPSFTEVGHAC